MCTVPAQVEERLQSVSQSADCAPSSEDVATSITAALEAVNDVMEWKREEISAQERIVEQFKRGVDEDLPDGLLARVNQAETAMKSALREMRCMVESFKKEATIDLPEQLASQLAVVEKNIKTISDTFNRRGNSISEPATASQEWEIRVI